MDLVTGGTGIVGAHVIDALLERGRPVRALVRRGSDRDIVLRILSHYHADGPARFARIQWVECDLADPVGLREALQGVEHLYHAAAVVSFDPRDDRAMLRVNIGGTAELIDAALEAGVARLCHVSSTATITPDPAGGPADESRPFDEGVRHSAYAISKYGAELEVYRGIAEGLDAVMVNPCVVIGPGPRGRSSMAMVERFRKGSRFFTGGSNAVVDARDVARAMVELTTRGATGERYLLIGEQLSYKTLTTLLAASNGHPAPRIEVPRWAMALAWRVERVRSLFGARPLITKHTARTTTRQRRYDGAKAQALLGFPFHDAASAVRNVAAFLDRS